MKPILIILFTLFLSSYFAQQRGSITGTVVDKSTKEPLIGVNITLEGKNTGAATDLNGKYEIKNIPVGTYRLKAAYIGYDTVIKTDISVNSVKPALLNFELSQSAIELEGVTVTSGYYDQIITEPISVASFNYEDIRRTPGGFEDVVRALSVIPGVAKQSAGRNDLIVRGGAPSENLYLIDGFVVPNINHFATQGATGGTNSYIDLDFVENTTFSTGGFSVKYGDKLSSVLGLTLRPGREDKIGGKALLSATQFGFNLEGPLSGNDNFIFSIRRSYLDFIFNAAGFSFVPQYWDALFKYNFSINNSNKISFLFTGAKDDVNFNNDDREDIIDNARILANSQKQYTAGISYKYLFKKGILDIRLGRNFTDYDAFQKDSLLNPVFLNKSKEASNTFGADLVYKSSETVEFNLGGAYEIVENKNDILFPNRFVTSYGDTLPLSKANIEKNFYKANLYGLLSKTLFNRLILNFGLRFDYFNAIKNKTTLSPRFSMKFVTSTLNSISFSAGIYRQNPSYIWLAYPGNENLEQIKVEQYILGFEHLLAADTKFKLEAFYKNYSKYPASSLRKYLLLANAGAGFGGSEEDFSSYGLEPLVSEGKGYSNGIEISLQKKSSDTPFYGIASLTLSNSKFTPLDNIEREGQFNQKVIFSLSAGYVKNDWIFSMKFRYGSGLPYTPVYKYGKKKVDEYLSSDLPASHSLDLRVDRFWHFDSFTLITYLDIQNIYNRKNINGYRWDFYENKIDKQKEFGILPSIGVSLEF